MAKTVAQRVKKYRMKHPERVKERKKKYYDSHPEQRKKEQRIDYLRHRSAYLRRSREGYRRHPEKAKADAMKWKKKNYYWQIEDNRRRLLKKELGGHFTKQEWEDKKKQYGYRCAFCGRSEEELLRETGVGLTVDHIIPLNKWKEYTKHHPLPYKCGDIENIQPLCLFCNSKKQDRI